MNMDINEYMSLAQAQNFLGVDSKTLTEYLDRLRITPISDGQGRGQIHTFILRRDVGHIATAYGITTAHGVVKARDERHLEILTSWPVADRGPFAPLALEMLEDGARHAGRRLLSGAHIVLAALGSNRIPQPSSGSLPQYLQQVYDLFRRADQVKPRLKAWVDAPAVPASGERCTLGFAQALEVARRGVGGRVIDWDILLWTMLTNDRDVRAALARPNHQPQAPSAPTPPYAPNSMPSFITDGRMRVVDPSAETPERYEATTGLRYKTRHGQEMEGLLARLRERKPGQAVVVRGLYGSPLDRVAVALADHLAWNQMQGDQAENLGGDYVMEQKIGTLRAAETVGEGAANALMSNILVARELHGMLLLTQGELLTRGETTAPSVNSQLLGIIAGIRDVPVIIAHEDADEAALNQTIALGDVNCLFARMDENSVEHARNAVMNNYRNVLRSKGLYLAEGAIEDALAFAPTMYEEANGGFKRKALPFSVAGLVFDAAELYTRVEREGGSPQNFARTARERAVALARSAEGGRAVVTALGLVEAAMNRAGEDAEMRKDAERLLTTWRNICRILQDAPTRLTDAAEAPLPELDADGLRPVTSDLLLIELFGSQNLRLQLWTAFKRDLATCCETLQAYVRYQD